MGERYRSGGIGLRRRPAHVATAGAGSAHARADHRRAGHGDELAARRPRAGADAGDGGAGRAAGVGVEAAPQQVQPGAEAADAGAVGAAGVAAAAAVEDCCREIGVTRGVFKVWMHNNKHNFVGGVHSARRAASASPPVPAAAAQPSPHTAVAASAPPPTPTSTSTAPPTVGAPAGVLLGKTS
jgi:hypothetical protein